MTIQHLLDALTLISDVFRRMPRQQCQDAHSFENSKHLVIWAQRAGVSEDTIVGRLQFFRHKPGERVE